MSEPRIITADEAKRLRGLLPDVPAEDEWRVEYEVFDRLARYTPWYETYAAAPDLAYTVEQQAEQIKRLQAYARQLEEDGNHGGYVDYYQEKHLREGDMQ